MKSASEYLMENDEEIQRLERKTDVKAVQHQAQWAGIARGMRVADIGCGPGITTRTLFEMVQPQGTAVGGELSHDRVAYAKEKYGVEGLDFVQLDARESMDHIGKFDFVWARFLLEYYRSRAFDIVKHLSGITRPGGTLCLIDLDYNCLNHFEMSDRLASAMRGVIAQLEGRADFDPHVGIKLYAFLYDLGFEEIDVSMSAHHLIFGDLKEVDAFNWTKKVEVAGRAAGYAFPEYPGGFDEFLAEFKDFFSSPRRFTYTPLIVCRGIKPKKNV